MAMDEIENLPNMYTRVDENGNGGFTCSVIWENCNVQIAHISDADGRQTGFQLFLNGKTETCLAKLSFEEMTRDLLQGLRKGK